jgi:hypothetical protein
LIDSPKALSALAILFGACVKEEIFSLSDVNAVVDAVPHYKDSFLKSVGDASL